MFSILTTFLVNAILKSRKLTSLKEYRARYRLSQTELGNLADVSRQTISLIERGDYNPSVTLALKLAKILNASVEQLFSYTEEEQ